MKNKKKEYFLDTNTIIHDPFCISKFEEHDVFIPWMVLEELDKLKKNRTGVGYSARAGLGYIEEIIGSSYDKIKGAKLNDKGGRLFIVADEQVLQGDNPDNKILSQVFKSLSHQPPKESEGYALVSKDTAMRIKAKVLGLCCENFKNDRSEKYKNYGKVLSKGDNQNGIHSTRYQVVSNEEKNAQILKLKGDDRSRDKIIKRRGIFSMGIQGKNIGQDCAIDALLDPDVEIVALNGPAGTGKTLLALAAGLHQTIEKKLFEQIIVTRSIEPLGRDIGYLPGDIEDKMDPWMQPIYDNLDILFHSHEGHNFLNQKKRQTSHQHRGSFKKYEDIHDEKLAGGKNYMYLLDIGIIKIEPLSFMRGRSLPKRFFLIDEAQNMRPIDIKTLVTRVGEGTKIVLTGDLSNDLSQIDNPYLDDTTNGLAYLIHRFIDQPNFCYIHLSDTVRSKVAEQGALLL